ncbi:hypothetical protein CPB83DRAFT_796782 [Crepidotus variabilis]|uniref:Peptide hydrolase n=1 Tax=Crepidotus variabilis TaxID=179855 RepID=A0A9P6E9U3_9AGAR|nr:hypothetical protein CPB83DRAFT_796782 [Crepidotus variabilis]
MKIASSFVLWTLACASAAQQVSNSYSSKKRLVEPQQLISDISKRNLLDHAKKFVDFSKLSNGTRAFGTAGYNATIDYIRKELLKTGYYNIELQTFPFLYSTGSSTFSSNGTNYPANWFTYGPAGDVEAPVIHINNQGCNVTDYPTTVPGSIALILRGSCDFGLKAALAGAAGAVGVVIFNNVAGPINGGTFNLPTRPEGPYVPTAGISDADGQAISDILSSGGEVIGSIHSEALNENRYSSNLLATSKSGNQNNIVMAGAHSDSVPAGPGINDNGSGSIGILEVALQLSKYETKQAVRFGFWTAEESGLVGSSQYVTSLTTAQNQKIALYLNFDMIASPNYGHFIYDGDGSQFNITGPAGSDKIEKTFQDYFKSIKYPSGSAAFNGRSDYGPFLTGGIPAGGMNTGAEGIKTEEQVALWGGQAGVAYDKCYHQACDGIDNLAVDAFERNAKGIAYAVATYARSIDNIPRARNATVAAKLASQLDSNSGSCDHAAVAM